MKKEYDFSKRERGEFYRPNAKLKLPIYLDDDNAEMMEKYAKRKRADVQTVVNEIIRANKDKIQAANQK